MKSKTRDFDNVLALTIYITHLGETLYAAPATGAAIGSRLLSRLKVHRQNNIVIDHLLFNNI